MGKQIIILMCGINIGIYIILLQDMIYDNNKLGISMSVFTLLLSILSATIMIDKPNKKLKTN